MGKFSKHFSGRFWHHVFVLPEPMPQPPTGCGQHLSCILQSPLWRSNALYNLIHVTMTVFIWLLYFSEVELDQMN